MANSRITNNVSFERKVRSMFLDKGMFVVRLNRPWMDTPFWLQGFLITTDNEIEALRKYCDFVYIDISRGKEAEFYMESDMNLPSNSYLEQQLDAKLRKFKHRNTTPLKDELVAIKSVLEDSTVKFVVLMENFRRGKKFKLSDIYDLITPLKDSISRNSEALPLLCTLRTNKEYTYSHAIDLCILALIFGRHLGLEDDELIKLASGLLLIDIGKTKIKPSILNKSTPLDDDEYRQINQHVDFSVQILKRMPDVPDDIVHIALTHHERFDGSGYPNGITKKNTPIYGRIAAILDCYGAMSKQRPYSPATTPHKSLQHLRQWKNRYFDEELVEQFQICMGSYPNGSLVELNSGQVALVISQTLNQRLTPVIMPVLNADKTPCMRYGLINLAGDKTTDSGKPLTILNDIMPDQYRLDLSKIYENLAAVMPDLPLPKSNFADKAGDTLSGLFGKFSR